MAVGVKLRQAHRPLPEDAMPNGEAPGPPEAARAVEAATWGVGGRGLILFHRFGVEIREVEGSYHQPGPAAVWFRLLTPVVAGEEPSANQRAIVAADFGNGISRQLHPREWMFMNADLTVGLARPPAGEWVCLRASSWYSAGGRGVVAGELYDRAGPVGRTMQTVFLEPVNPSP